MKSNKERQCGEIKDEMEGVKMGTKMRKERGRGRCRGVV